VVHTRSPGSLELPAATAFRPPFLHGGLRSLHELAFAIAATGRRVELRGVVHRATFDALAAASGVAPVLPATPRRPDSNDIVIVAEGDEDPLYMGRALFSGARVVLFAMAPPGLFGWPFGAGWSRPSPLTVDIDDVARPEHFHAIAGMGVTLWTHMGRLCELSEAAGVPCRFIGNGSPLAVHAPVDKRTDVAWLRANRWAELAEPVARQLHARMDGIELTSHEALLRRLGAARVLLWPSRVEGHGRVLCEARSVGCVPVALASNVFATGLAERFGVVPVDSVEDMPRQVQRLLADPARLHTLADDGRAAAAAQVDWARYVRRVDEGLHEVEDNHDPAAAARAAIAARTWEVLMAAEARRLSLVLARRAVRLAVRASAFGRPHAHRRRSVGPG
jgi:hypothetical protein